MSLTTTKSAHSVAITVDRLVAALGKRGISVLARIDHAAGARQAGLELGDEVLVIFGDPRVGTLLMQVDAAVGYELPLRVLLWDAGGQTMIGYRRPTELANDFAVGSQLETLKRMESLLAQITLRSRVPTLRTET